MQQHVVNRGTVRETKLGELESGLLGELESGLLGELESGLLGELESGLESELRNLYLGNTASSKKNKCAITMC